MGLRVSSEWGSLSNGNGRKFKFNKAACGPAAGMDLHLPSESRPRPPTAQVSGLKCALGAEGHLQGTRVVHHTLSGDGEARWTLGGEQHGIRV